MPVIYPSKPDFKNRAERIVYEYMQENFPDEYVVYFNYIANLKEFDFAVLIPYRGIAIIEVKNWYADEIVKVRDNNSIEYRDIDGNLKTAPSPLKQSIGYRFDFLNRVRDEIGAKPLIYSFVCYPNISKKQYMGKELNIISKIESTILKDDLKQLYGVEHKLSGRMWEARVIGEDEFDEELMYKVRLLFESKEDIDQSLEKIEKRENNKKQTEEKTRKKYSVLQYISGNISGRRYKEIINELIRYWEEGTKIAFITDYVCFTDEMRRELKESIKEKNLEKHFKLSDQDIKNDVIFNFSFHFLEKSLEIDLDEEFRVINGDFNEKHRTILEKFHDETTFNFKQYEIEHAPLNKNILVKAGAGSGKTYSMISRIGYLVFFEELDANTLQQNITLITFTNEAAKNMKRRLQKYFQNLYLITKNYSIFQMIEAVNEMNISTIHSLAKKILKICSVQMGYGKDFRIVSGKYERDAILEKIIDEYYRNNPDIQGILNMSIYQLRRSLQDIISKLENKNIDILQTDLDFGNNEIDLFIKDILKDMEKEARSDFYEQNEIRLSDLMMKLSELLNDTNVDFNQLKVKYLFIDEFQDTDDRQIQLMNQFQKQLNFNFFIVGDIKQCIYRFRGAQDKAFSQLIGVDDEFEELVRKKWGLPFSLNKNYRSDSSLLRKFETVFEKWGKSDTQLLKYVTSKDRLTSHMDFHQSKYKKVQLEEWKDDTRIKEKLLEVLHREYEEVEGIKKIAILVRENWQIEKVVNMVGDQFFIEADYGRSIFTMQSTIDLYKLIIALQHPNTPKYLFNLFDSNYIDQPMPKKALYMMKDDQEKMIQYFTQLEPIPNWGQYLANLKVQPILKVLKDLIDETKPWNNYAKISKREDDQHKYRSYYKRNLEKVFEHILKMKNIDYLTLNGIEKYLRIMIVTGQNEAGRENTGTISDKGKQIYCMTVHASKGLEFDTVILPFTYEDLERDKVNNNVDIVITEKDQVGYQIPIEDQGNSKNSNLSNFYYSIQRDQEKNFRVQEETRILYVAMTRTVQRFIYFSYADKKQKKKYSWQSLIEGDI